MTSAKVCPATWSRNTSSQNRTLIHESKADTLTLPTPTTSSLRKPLQAPLPYCSTMHYVSPGLSEASARKHMTWMEKSVPLAL